MTVPASPAMQHARSSRAGSAPDFLDFRVLSGAKPSGMAR